MAITPSLLHCRRCDKYLAVEEFSKTGEGRRIPYSLLCKTCEVTYTGGCAVCGADTPQGKSYCAGCQKRIERKPRSLIKVERKVCLTCRKEKPVSEFHRSMSTIDSFNDRCKVCNSALANYHQRKRKEKNPALYYADTVSRTQAHRVKKLQGSSDALSALVFARLWDKQQGRCHYCSKPMNPFVDLTLEHIIPVARGGTNQEQNLVLACKTCNHSKNDRTDQEYEEYKAYLALLDGQN